MAIPIKPSSPEPKSQKAAGRGTADTSNEAYGFVLTMVPAKLSKTDAPAGPSALRLVAKLSAAEKMDSEPAVNVPADVP